MLVTPSGNRASRRGRGSRVLKTIPTWGKQTRKAQRAWTNSASLKGNSGWKLPAAGLSRGVLAILSEAFTPDSDRPSGVYMKFHPRIAPIKAAIFPLVKKDGMPETAQKLYMDLRKKFPTQFDVKQTIGKRYARMDEAGTPFCFAIDDVTMKDQTVTVRHRDTPRVDVPERSSLDKVARYVTDHIS